MISDDNGGGGGVVFMMNYMLNIAEKNH